jgi:hypothetical protein
MTNDFRPGSFMCSHSSILASLIWQMQPIFDELELVTSTCFIKHVEMVQNLAHGCMMA